MGKWFAPNAVCCSHGLEEPKDHSSDSYFCSTNMTETTSKFTHTVKYSYLPSAMRPIPQSEELLVPKPLENLTFSDDNSDSDEDHRQQDGDKVDCDLTFEASCCSSVPHLLAQGDLNDLVCDLNLSKKPC
jgi:hypothetical protein